jgi:predicted nucleic acid-binding protein
VVIATAVAGRAEAISPGDRDLLEFQRVGDVVVVTSRDFWKWDAGQ